MLFGYFLAIQKVAYSVLRCERNINRMKRSVAKISTPAVKADLGLRKALRSRKKDPAWATAQAGPLAVRPGTEKQKNAPGLYEE